MTNSFKTACLNTPLCFSLINTVGKQHPVHISTLIIYNTKKLLRMQVWTSSILSWFPSSLSLQNRRISHKKNLYTNIKSRPTAIIGVDVPPMTIHLWHILFSAGFQQPSVLLLIMVHQEGWLFCILICLQVKMFTNIHRLLRIRKNSFQL